MNDSILTKNIKQSYDEINRNYKIIKEIDFSKDIDVEKSDFFDIDTQTQYLTFSFKEVERINIEDHEQIIGKIERNHDGIGLVPVKSWQSDENQKVNWVCIDKKVIGRNIYIEIEKSSKIHCYLVWSNYHDYEARKRTPIFETNPKISDSIEKEIFYNFNFHGENNIGFGVTLGRNSKSWTHFKKIENNVLKLKIDKGYMRINEDKFSIPSYNTFKNFIEKKDVYFLLGTYTTDINQYVRIKRFSIYDREGYVYLKPFRLKGERIQVLMLYSRDASIDYYCDKVEKWISIKNSQNIISAIDELRLRIKMKENCKIYKIYFLKK